MRAYVLACVRASVHVCVCACVCVYVRAMCYNLNASTENVLFGLLGMHFHYMYLPENQ